MVLLALTVVVSVLTVVPGRATRLQGGVHLVLLASFLFLAVNPWTHCGRRPGCKGRRPRRAGWLAVAVGFEPTEACTSHAFEACSFGRSDTPPPERLQVPPIAEERA